VVVASEVAEVVASLGESGAGACGDVLGETHSGRCCCGEPWFEEDCMHEATVTWLRTVRDFFEITSEQR
jgi:hypothetical protein